MIPAKKILELDDVDAGNGNSRKNTEDYESGQDEKDPIAQCFVFDNELNFAYESVPHMLYDTPPGVLDNDASGSRDRNPFERKFFRQNASSYDLNKRFLPVRTQMQTLGKKR